MDWFVGLDAHASSRTLGVVSPSVQRVGSHVVETNARCLIEAVRQIPEPRHICLEEGTRSGSSMIGKLFHVLSLDAGWQHLPFESAVVPGYASSWQRVIEASSGGFWVARHDRRAVRLMTWEGQSAMELGGATSWFPELTPEERRKDLTQEPPAPDLWALHLDELDRLWVVHNVPDPTYRGGAGVFVDGFNDIFDSRIEVYDSRSGQLLASATTPWFVHGITQAGHVVAGRERSWGRFVAGGGVIRGVLGRDHRRSKGSTHDDRQARSHPPR